MSFRRSQYIYRFRLPGGVSNMANCTLQSLFREPTKRLTDRAAFAQAVSRLSSASREQEKERLTKPREVQATGCLRKAN
ncbi:MAG: hypothetical protein ABFD54_08580 [Armatimonadota bacterium]|nr:hypothetical protein [bacterium]